MARSFTLLLFIPFATSGQVNYEHLKIKDDSIYVYRNHPYTGIATWEHSAFNEDIVVKFNLLRGKIDKFNFVYIDNRVEKLNAFYDYTALQGQIRKYSDEGLLDAYASYDSGKCVYRFQKYLNYQLEYFDSISSNGTEIEKYFFNNGRTKDEQIVKGKKISRRTWDSSGTLLKTDTTLRPTFDALFETDWHRLRMKFSEARRPFSLEKGRFKGEEYTLSVEYNKSGGLERCGIRGKNYLYTKEWWPDTIIPKGETFITRPQKGFIKKWNNSGKLEYNLSPNRWDKLHKEYKIDR